MGMTRRCLFALRLDAFVMKKGGNGSEICVLTMAADNPESEGAKFVARLNNWGANATWIPVLQSNQSSSAFDPLNVAALRGCVGFFFCGGTRSKILRALRRDGVDSPAMIAIRDQLKAGAVLAGTSAGMATQVLLTCPPSKSER